MDIPNKTDISTLGQNSQELHLRKIVKKSIRALALGGIMLLATIITNFYCILVEEDRLETNEYLNQYQIGRAHV